MLHFILFFIRLVFPPFNLRFNFTPFSFEENKINSHQIAFFSLLQD